VLTFLDLWEHAEHVISRLCHFQVIDSANKNAKLVKGRRDDKVVMRTKSEIDEFKETALPVLLEVGFYQ